MANNIIFLDVPEGLNTEEEIAEFILTQAESQFQRNGKNRGIVDFLEQMGKDIEKSWPEISKNYYLNNLSATSYAYTHFNADEGLGGDKAPEIYPFHSDIDHLHSSRDITPDSPVNEIADFIVFDIVEDRPSTLSKKAFGPRKENGPRFRYWAQVEGILEEGYPAQTLQYPVLAKRKEYIIEFKAFAQTSKMAHLMIKTIEYYFDIKKESLLELGAQHFYTMGSSQGTKVHKESGMAYRSVDVYLKMEEWYIGKPSGIIEKVDITWETVLTNI